MAKEMYVQIVKPFPGLDKELIGKAVFCYRIDSENEVYLPSPTMPLGVFQKELFDIEATEVPPIPWWAGNLLVEKPEKFFMVRVLGYGYGLWHEDQIGREYLCIEETPLHFRLPTFYDGHQPTTSVKAISIDRERATKISHPDQELKVVVIGHSDEDFWYKDQEGVEFVITRIKDDGFVLKTRRLEEGEKEPYPSLIMPPPGKAKTIMVAPMILMRDAKPLFDFPDWEWESSEPLVWEHCEACGFPSRFLKTYIDKHLLCPLCANTYAGTALNDPGLGNSKILFSISYIGNMLLEAIAATQEDPAKFLAHLQNDLERRGN